MSDLTTGKGKAFLSSLAVLWLKNIGRTALSYCTLSSLKPYIQKADVGCWCLGADFLEVFYIGQVHCSKARRLDLKEKKRQENVEIF